MKSQDNDRRMSDLRRKSGDVAALLKQLSHPPRLLILCTLADGEKSVGDIEQACGASQSSVSQFLKSMRLDGLVTARREGKKVYYGIADKRITELVRALYIIFCS